MICLQRLHFGYFGNRSSRGPRARWLGCLCYRRSPEVADRTSAAAASSQGVLCDLGDRYFDWGWIEFYVIQSDPGTILVRGHQRCSGGAGDGPDDASYRQYKGHGPIYGDRRPAFYGVAGDRRHGGCGRWDVYYCSHVDTVA